MDISVIIPAYNAAHEITECLAALAASSEQAAEILVVDDGSTDDTARVAAATGARVVRQQENRGPAAARNVGYMHARGDVPCGRARGSPAGIQRRARDHRVSCRA